MKRHSSALYSPDCCRADSNSSCSKPFIFRVLISNLLKRKMLGIEPRPQLLSIQRFVQNTPGERGRGGWVRGRVRTGDISDILDRGQSAQRVGSYARRGGLRATPWLAPSAYRISSALRAKICAFRVCWRRRGQRLLRSSRLIQDGLHCARSGRPARKPAGPAAWLQLH